MKIILILGFSLIAVISIYFFILGKQSKQQSPIGLVNNQLANCPNKPNCVCSEESAITKEPIQPLSTIDKAQLQQAIKDTGGQVTTVQDNYIAATYTSKLFSFVDDVELRIDPTNNITHIRSASRVGHSDLGANTKRVTAIRQALNK